MSMDGNTCIRVKTTYLEVLEFLLGPHPPHAALEQDDGAPCLPVPRPRLPAAAVPLDRRGPVLAEHRREVLPTPHAAGERLDGDGGISDLQVVAPAAVAAPRLLDDDGRPRLAQELGESEDEKRVLK